MSCSVSAVTSLCRGYLTNFKVQSVPLAQLDKIFLPSTDHEGSSHHHPILRQFDPIHIFMAIASNAHFNIILLHMLTSKFPHPEFRTHYLRWILRPAQFILLYLT